ncbi:MAG: hypothetical protein QG670_920 [Thermoproteota archaeon]|nr:hypothetical protein [Thermoproteota archaeon]
MTLSEQQNVHRDCVNLFVTNLCNMSCPYCCVKDWITQDKEKAQYMTLADLDRVIEWLKVSRINSVQLIGGEPMLHPEITKFVEKIMENRIQIRCILTNGLGDTELYKKVIKMTRTWLVNVNHPSTYTKKEWELLNRNLELLKWKSEDRPIGHNRDDQNWLSLQLSITFYKENQEYDYIINLAKKYDCPFIRYAPSHPSSDKTNLYFDFEGLTKFKNTLMNFLKSCIREGIKPQLECPLPPCIFTPSDMSFLLRFTGGVRFSCAPHLDVNPDLTVGYCASMREIISNHKIKDANAQDIFRMQSIGMRMYKECTLPHCNGCYHFLNNVCQGFCLRYKVDFLKSKRTQKLNSI